MSEHNLGAPPQVFISLVNSGEAKAISPGPNQPVKLTRFSSFRAEARCLLWLQLLTLNGFMGCMLLTVIGQMI